MKYTIHIFILTFLSFSSVQAQKFACKSDLDFLVERYTKDYSGFQDFKILHPDYQQQLKSIVKKSSSTNDVLKCHQVIAELISYLDNGHVVFGALEENPKFDELYEDDDKDYYPSIIFPNSQTAILTIKTGNIEYKIDLDTLIKAHQTRLDSIEHLIIDLRGNSGGGDDTYNNVIPFIYTNPIVTNGTYLWTSENNISLFERYVNNPDIPKETRQKLKTLVKKGIENPNTFVLLGESETDTIRIDAVKEFPKKVSILIDGKCTSATEEFILKAKQSSKTTIYGFESTGGALDYSNLNPVITPSGYWYATVPTTRSSRLPENPIDPDGIEPDVLVDKDVNNLIEFVMSRHKNDKE